MLEEIFITVYFTDLIDIKCFQALHHLLPPATISLDSDSENDGKKADKSKVVLQKRGRRNTKSSQKKNWKVPTKPTKRHPGVIDSKKSTLLLIDHQQSVKEEIEKFAVSQRKAKSLRFHPIMAVVMNERSLPRKFYVFVENLLYETESFRNCMETYMKSFWVFSLDYPKEGKRVCKCMAQLCFNLYSDDKSLSTIIKDWMHEITTNE